MDDREPQRDPLTGRYLRGLEDPRARSQDEWRRLGGRIGHAARSRLAALRGERTWWEEMASWAGAVVPVGLAAAIIALLLIARAGTGPAGATETGTGPSADTAGSVAGFLTALTQGQDEPALADAAVGPLSTDWFLRTAVAQ